MTEFTKGSIIVDGKEDKSIQQCASHINKGELVAFPTETVYGLGADALNPSAVLKIFKAKERPLNDPVIVHVVGDNSLTRSLIAPEVLEVKEISQIFNRLTKTFWPGPLTIVLKANPKVVPDCITGGTNCVGIRCPRNVIARKLIEVSKTPIAAPSANKFGHVSPTSYQHVYEDLGNTEYPIMILKGKEKKIEKEESENCCKIGIESTVLKIEKGKKNEVLFKILRRGGTSSLKIADFVDNFNRENRDKDNSFTVDLEIVQSIVKDDSKQGMQSPGQLITHYSPRIPSYIIKNFFDKIDGDAPKEIQNSKKFELKDTVLIDFNKQFLPFKEKFLDYLDLSESGNLAEAANNLFKSLRLAEKVKNAKIIILPNLSLISKEHSDACHDRLFRAASGNHCILNKRNIFIL